MSLIYTGPEERTVFNTFVDAVPFNELTHPCLVRASPVALRKRHQRLNAACHFISEGASHTSPVLEASGRKEPN